MAEHVILKDFGESYANVFGEADDIWFTRESAANPPEVFILWEPYLDAVMSGVMPGPGGWESFSLEYHTSEPWKDRMWTMTDIGSFVAQLDNADIDAIRRHPFGIEVTALLPELRAFLAHATESGQTVTVEAH